MKKVIIHKGEIEICELTKDIAKEMARLGDNPNVFKCVSDSFPNPYTYEKALEFIAKAQEQKIGHIFGIYWKGTFVGNIGLHSKLDWNGNLLKSAILLEKNIGEMELVPKQFH